MVDAAPAAPPMQCLEVAKPAPKSSKRPEPLHVVREVLGAAAQRAVLARVPGDLGGLAADAAEGVRLDLVGGPPAEAFAAARAVFRAAAAKGPAAQPAGPNGKRSAGVRRKGTASGTRNLVPASKHTPQSTSTTEPSRTSNKTFSRWRSPRPSA